MTEYVLSFKPALPGFGRHDPSAAIFRDGQLVFGVEEERFTREKHAVSTFPEQAIRACLDYCGIDLPALAKIVLPYDPRLGTRMFRYQLRESLAGDDPLPLRLREAERTVEKHVARRFFTRTITGQVVDRLAKIDSPVPPVETQEHHKCHAASAYYPSGQDRSVVVTVDGKGEYDSTAVWQGTKNGVSRVRTWEVPNSLGFFFAVVTEYLGYHAYNGEGKVMGLAPYGKPNRDIESTLREHVTAGVDYDVTAITQYGIEPGVEKLEEMFDRPRNRTRGEFDQWEKDLAFAAQSFVEETVVGIVEHYVDKLGTGAVCLAGGVALNCKMNKRVQESEAVEDLFIQPIAHDGGLALGGGMLETTPTETPVMERVYWGPEYGRTDIEAVLEETKTDYTEPDNLERAVAERIADGELVGWYQGRLEMGPRALGNRSILADPRTTASRDRVNEYVKHREGWRPFAPSMLEEAIDDYLVNATPSPFMIKTFEVEPEKQDEIPAVLHPADGTTRPQTVTESQNERYYTLIKEFENVTGVPAVLNTSFNDHAEPIVSTPRETLKDFYGMGLDVLVLGDYLVGK